ncbi:hypothetical protein V8C86DRAFT_3177052, partial [Haematococcus lacustris]
VAAALTVVQAELAQLPPNLPELSRPGKLVDGVQRLGRDVDRIVNAVQATGSNAGDNYNCLHNKLLDTFARTVHASRPSFNMAANGDKAEIFSDDSDADEDNSKDGTNPRTLQDVKGILMEMRAYELPGYNPYPAVLHIIQRHQPSWKQHVYKCLDDSSAALGNQLLLLVDTHLKLFPRLLPRMRTLVSQLVKEKQASTRMKLQELLDMEGGYPVTKNDHYFTSCKAAFLEKLKDAHVKVRQSPIISSMHPKTPPTISPTKSPTISSEDESALDVMATTLAYYKVASKRFVDCSVLYMRAYLQQALADDFQAYMDREMSKMAGFDEGLGHSMRQHWSWSDPVLSLLEEEPAAARLRQHLQGREDKLVALEQLLAEHDLPHVPHNPSPAPPRPVGAACLATPKLPMDRLYSTSALRATMALRLPRQLRTSCTPAPRQLMSLC